MEDKIMEDKNKPTYKFITEEGEETLSPFKRKIGKTMVTTETFTLFEAMQYLAKLKKARDDKRAEAEGFDAMITAYEEEIQMIDSTLSINELEKEFIEMEAARTADEKAEEAGVAE